MRLVYDGGVESGGTTGDPMPHAAPIRAVDDDVVSTVERVVADHSSILMAGETDDERDVIDSEAAVAFGVQQLAMRLRAAERCTIVVCIPAASGSHERELGGTVVDASESFVRLESADQEWLIASAAIVSACLLPIATTEEAPVTDRSLLRSFTEDQAPVVLQLISGRRVAGRIVGVGKDHCDVRAALESDVLSMPFTSVVCASRAR